MKKKLLIFLLTISINFIITGCEKNNNSIANPDENEVVEKVQEAKVEKEKSEELTDDEIFELALSKFKNATSYKVHINSKYESSNYSYSEEFDNLVDKNSNIIIMKNDSSESFADLGNSKLIYNETGCGFGWIYSNIDTKYDINTYDMYSVINELTSSDILNVKNGIYTFKVPTSKISNKYYLAPNFEYMEVFDVQVALTIKNNMVDNLELSYKDRNSISTKIYTFSDFDKIKNILPEDALNAEYKEPGWQSCF